MVTGMKVEEFNVFVTKMCQGRFFNVTVRNKHYELTWTETTQDLAYEAVPLMVSEIQAGRGRARGIFTR